MTFFYDLNKKLSDLAAKQTLNEAASHQAKTTMKHVDASNASSKVKAAIGKAAKDIKPGTKGYGDRAAALTAAGVPDDRGPRTNEASTGDYSAKKARAGKDIGKPGKAFSKIAKSAGEKYGSKAAGERVAGAVLKKLRTKESMGMTDEGNAFSKAVVDAKKDGIQPGEKINVGGKTYPVKEAHGDVGQVLGKMANDVNQFKQSGELSDNLYNALFDLWMDEMPYGTAKARSGDPYEWITQRLDQEVGMSEGSSSMTPKQKSFAALAEPKDKITFADKIAGAKKEVDEMLGDVAAEAMKKALGGHGEEVAEEDNNPFTNWKKPRAERPKVGSVERGALHDIEHTSTGRKVTRRVDPNTGHSVGSDDDAPASGEKRGRGRPAGKGAGKSIGAKGPSGKSKLMTREGEVSTGNLQKMHQLVSGLKMYVQDEDGQALLKELTGLVKHYMNQGGEKPLDEKADKRDNHAEKAGKKVTKDIEYDEKKKDGIHGKKRGTEDDKAEKAGKKVTKDIEYDEKKSKKKEEVDETTTAGSVATAPSTGKSNGIFGKSVYENKLAESFNNKLKTVLTEGMSINMSVGEDGTKTLSVNATDEDALQLAQLLKMAGLGGGEEACPTCGESACGCEQVSEGDLANSPEPEYSDANTMLNTLSGGLNGRKSTGQTTIPVIASQLNRQQSVAENAEAHLWNLYNRYDKK